jgi:electron transfer flavoprotein beta subunit
LRIAVLVKQVVDVSTGPGATAADTPRAMNTYDAYAISEAISLKERTGAEVTVVSAGPPPVTDVVVRGLATGADRGLHIEVDDPDGMDTLALATVLAGQLSEGSFDLVLAGQTTDDYETGQVGMQVAELLDVPHVSQATHVEVDGNTVLVTRDAVGRRERVRVPAPCVVMILSGRDSPQRYPSLRGMMAAKRKPLESVSPAVAPVRRLSWSEPRSPRRDQEGTILRDLPPDEAASRLVAWLRERRLV